MINLDYFSLISRQPIFFSNIGNFKSPLLKDIANLTYPVYQSYLSYLLITPEKYCEDLSNMLSEDNTYSKLDSKDKNMFDMIAQSPSLQQHYSDIFSFFMTEDVTFDKKAGIFCTFSQKDENNSIIPTGIINREVFAEVCNVILQLNGIKNRSDKKQEQKFKNKMAEELYEKMQNDSSEKSSQSKQDSNLELPNIISALAAINPGLNIINIWDITVNQLYDQFMRQQLNCSFDIESMSVAAWGDSNNKFDASRWYKNIHDETGA